MTSIAVPVAVIEKGGLGVALARSAELTRGYRWTIFGVHFVLGLIIFIVAVVVGTLFGVASASGAPASSGTGALVFFPIGAFFSAWLACTNAVVYHDLRVIKENIDIESIAAVFD